MVNADGFDALYPRYRGGRPQTFTLAKRQEIKRIALSDPQDLDQPFATWSLSNLRARLSFALADRGWSPQ
ncbi:MAG TPA: helix-turn-helix domain-containing protein [Solirubrobacteraceae bacterium]|nr:helix-turn-helix domain-containing protein [Solirubrobacteraceae bacterium]